MVCIFPQQEDANDGLLTEPWERRILSFNSSLQKWPKKVLFHLKESEIRNFVWGLHWRTLKVENYSLPPKYFSWQMRVQKHAFNIIMQNSLLKNRRHSTESILWHLSNSKTETNLYCRSVLVNLVFIVIAEAGLKKASGIRSGEEISRLQSELRNWKNIPEEGNGKPLLPRKLYGCFYEVIKIWAGFKEEFTFNGKWEGS